MGILNEKKSTFQRFGTIFNSQNVYYIYQTNKKRNKKFRIIYTLTKVSLCIHSTIGRGAAMLNVCVLVKGQQQRKRHLKINIWEMVTILRLLLLPRILYR